ncbi:MAG: UDP-N-acetylglucosamine 2-epimerase (non-hydrolyzing) [Planctomycetota bacterium]
MVVTSTEVIKMAPVILELRNRSWTHVEVLATAQHRELLDPFLHLFDLRPDRDLDIMQPDQALPRLTADLLMALHEHLEQNSPDLILAQGDTTTVFVTALAAFYHKIPFGHVEAGLRTGNLDNPFPEEANRAMAGRLARFHFAPTQGAKDHLLREGIHKERIHVTGNTVIDALHDVAARDIPLDAPLDPAKRMLLVTAHRRENFGAPFLGICRALLKIVSKNPDVQVLYPVHPNPNVRKVAYKELAGNPQVILIDPLEYGPFITAMKRSYLILTDSGGVQEEAPALGKPVLVLRAETERPEAVEAGVARLVGTCPETIVSAVQKLLDDEESYRSMVRGESPYGDGKAARRIVDILEKSFESHDAKSR